MRACANILAGITSLCISLLALFLVIWVSIKLTDISFNGLDYEFQCLLGTNENRYTFTSNNCLMLQILSGLTIGVGFVIGIMQCFTCNLCGARDPRDGVERPTSYQPTCRAPRRRTGRSGQDLLARSCS